MTLLLAAISIMACSPFAPAMRPAVYDPLPQTYSLYPVEVPDPSPWWYDLQTAELNRLLDRAFAGNLTLRQACARLEQSRALAVQAGADLYPQTDATGGASRSANATAP